VFSIILHLYFIWTVFSISHQKKKVFSVIKKLILQTNLLFRYEIYYYSVLKRYKKYFEQRHNVVKSDWNPLVIFDLDIGIKMIDTRDITGLSWLIILLLLYYTSVSPQVIRVSFLIIITIIGPMICALGVYNIM